MHVCVTRCNSNTTLRDVSDVHLLEKEEKYMEQALTKIIAKDLSSPKTKCLNALFHKAAAVGAVTQATS